MDDGALKIDLTSQACMRDPSPTLARLREAGPVVRLRLPLLRSIWVATTYEAAHDVLKDDDAFVMEPANAGRRKAPWIRWWMPRMVRVLSENMLLRDNPDHRRLRGLVDQAFRRQNIDDLRGRIAALCAELLDRMAREGSADLLEGFARPLPLAVISELLGLPEEDRPRFQAWARGIFSARSLPGIVATLPKFSRLFAYYRRHFDECRRNPRPGLITALVQAEQDGQTLSENELLAMAILLLFAGHETTVHLISGGVLALLDHPEAKRWLMDDWSRAPAAVEELLRFVSPVQLSKPRLVRRDLTFHGRPLHQGEAILPILAAANHDPARFVDPERLDLARAPNPHLAFGSGMHFCLGAQLARAEAQVALETLLTRFPDLRLGVSPSELTYTGRLGLRALTALPVRWTAARAAVPAR
jgi:cytochrome P450